MIPFFYLLLTLCGPVKAMAHRPVSSHYYYYGAYSVRDFGATGDGQTDDTQAINLALKRAHDEGHDLYFPAGTYLCNQKDAIGNILTLQADGSPSMTLFGDGNGSIIKTTQDQG